MSDMDGASTSMAWGHSQEGSGALVDNSMSSRTNSRSSKIEVSEEEDPAPLPSHPHSLEKSKQFAGSRARLPRPLQLSRRRASSPIRRSVSQRHAGVAEPPSRFLIRVLPPTYIPHDPPHPRVSPHCTGYGPPEDFACGTLITLHPSLPAQIASIAREYGLPSTGGMVVYLLETSTGQGKDTFDDGGPRIGDNAWQSLWNHLFEPEPLALGSDFDYQEGEQYEEQYANPVPPLPNMQQYRPTPSTPPHDTRSETSSYDEQSDAMPESYTSSSRKLQTRSIPADFPPTPQNFQTVRPVSTSSKHRARQSLGHTPNAMRLSSRQSNHATPQSAYYDYSIRHGSAPPSPAFMSKVIVGKIRFSIDKRGPGKWFDAWLEAAKQPRGLGEPSLLDSDKSNRSQTLLGFTLSASKPSIQPDSPLHQEITAQSAESSPLSGKRSKSPIPSAPAPPAPTQAPVRLAMPARSDSHYSLADSTAESTATSRVAESTDSPFGLEDALTPRSKFGSPVAPDETPVVSQENFENQSRSSMGSSHSSAARSSAPTVHGQNLSYRSERDVQPLSPTSEYENESEDQDANQGYQQMTDDENEPLLDDEDESEAGHEAANETVHTLSMHNDPLADVFPDEQEWPQLQSMQTMQATVLQENGLPHEDNYAGLGIAGVRASPPPSHEEEGTMPPEDDIKDIQALLAGQHNTPATLLSSPIMLDQAAFESAVVVSPPLVEDGHSRLSVATTISTTSDNPSNISAEIEDPEKAQRIAKAGANDWSTAFNEAGFQIPRSTHTSTATFDYIPPITGSPSSLRDREISNTSTLTVPQDDRDDASRLSTIAMMHDLDEIERALAELSPRNTKSTSNGPRLHSSFSLSSSSSGRSARSVATTNETHLDAPPPAEEEAAMTTPQMPHNATFAHLQAPNTASPARTSSLSAAKILATVPVPPLPSLPAHPESIVVDSASPISRIAPTPPPVDHSGPLTERNPASSGNLDVETPRNNAGFGSLKISKPWGQKERSDSMNSDEQPPKSPLNFFTKPSAAFKFWQREGSTSPSASPTDMDFPATSASEVAPPPPAQPKKSPQFLRSFLKSSNERREADVTPLVVPAAPVAELHPIESLPVDAGDLAVPNNPRVDQWVPTTPELAHHFPNASAPVTPADNLHDKTRPSAISYSSSRQRNKNSRLSTELKDLMSSMQNFGMEEDLEAPKALPDIPQTPADEEGGIFANINKTLLSVTQSPIISPETINRS